MGEEWVKSESARIKVRKNGKAGGASIDLQWEIEYNQISSI
jgi:hypothetical protein